MTLKLYYDLMSQPSRALYILLKSVNCNFESNYVDLRKGEHFTEEFSKLNKFQKVPIIDHDGFVLSESVAIYKYLSREGMIPDNLFPKDSKLQARVDEFLEWHHIGLRLNCAMYFRAVFLDPKFFGRKNTPEQIEGYMKRMETSLGEFNSKWLGSGRHFILGDNITVADLVAACELEQPRMAGYDTLKKFDNIAVWYEKVRNHFNPHYDEGHVVVRKIISSNAQAESKL